MIRIAGSPPAVKPQRSRPLPAVTIWCRATERDPGAEDANPIVYATQRETRSRGQRGWLFRLLRVCLALIILVALALGAGALWLRRAMQAQLPQLDGDRRTFAVTKPVTVQRDHQGVPHISAASIDDLIAAQAYVTAQDRLWQMDMMRRVAAGEVAEVLGSNFVEHDRIQRVLQFRQTAERLTASLSPQDRRFFEDYARGVNAYINEADALPAEFRLLNYQPRRWQPVDSVLIVLSMVQTLD